MAVEGDATIVYVREATDEQKRRAAELKLPSNFYLYESAPPCPGCRGCDDIDAGDAPAVVDTAAIVKPNPVDAREKAQTAPTPSIMQWKLSDASTSQLSFSSLISSSDSGFSKPEAFSWSGTGQPIFGVC